ncbi:MAG: IS3 family transposase, partial [Alphaproteobacteria bacterium]|nr:IS3 family transposase [Alphaproteobacteria bacterium]
MQLSADRPVHLLRSPGAAGRSGRLSARARRDLALRSGIERVFAKNWRVYSLRKVWRQLGGEGFAVARCPVTKLMKSRGVQGVCHG